MSDIFLSYSRHDVDKARLLARALEAEGFSVFWDRHIQAGQVFDQVIREELNDAGAVIVLWSRDSVASDWVKDEAERAKARGALVPVLIDDVPLPLGFGRVQTAEIRAWRGGPSYEAVTQIAKGARAVMAAPPPGLPARGATPSHRSPRRPRRRRLLLFGGGVVLIGLAAVAAGALRLLFGGGGVVSTPTGMVLVPAGEHTLGAPSSYVDAPNDGVAVVEEHRVDTPEFWIEQEPVSHAEYRAFVLAKARSDLDEWQELAPAAWLRYGGADVISTSYPAGDAARPVDGVPSADAAEEYCRFAGRRLVTETEWELASRANKIGAGGVQEWVADGRVETSAIVDPATRGDPGGIRFGLVARARDGGLVELTVRILESGPPAPLEWRVAIRNYADPGPVAAVAAAGAGDPIASGEVSAVGAGPVELAIEQAGDTLRFLVDDQMVHEGIVPAAAPAGLVGFVVESINAEVAHIHFDYLGSSAGA